MELKTVNKFHEFPMSQYLAVHCFQLTNSYVVLSKQSSHCRTQSMVHLSVFQITRNFYVLLHSVIVTCNLSDLKCEIPE